MDRHRIAKGRPYVRRFLFVVLIATVAIAMVHVAAGLEAPSSDAEMRRATPGETTPFSPPGTSVPPERTATATHTDSETTPTRDSDGAKSGAQSPTSTSENGSGGAASRGPTPNSGESNSGGGPVLDIDLQGFLKWALDWIAEGLLALVNGVLSAVLKPIVGTPAPTSEESWFVFGTPDNQPWSGLYEQVYLRFVLPLAAGTIFISLAYIGIRAGGTTARRTRQLLGRVALATLAVFFWFPVASGALQLADAVGVVIATGGPSSTGSLIQNFGDALKVGGGGAVLLLVIYAVETTLIVIAAVAYAIRWLALIVLTLTMPLLAAVWAVDIWPLTSLASIARRAAEVYPGLLIAGLPAAFLLRIAVVAEFRFGFGGLFAVLASAALIPAATAASAATVIWSNRRMRAITSQSARASQSAAQNAPEAARRTRTGAGETVRGARNVHRGITQRPAVTKEGEEAIWSGDSTAHRVGRRGRNAAARSGAEMERGKRKLGEYREARAADDRELSDELRSDLRHAGAQTRASIGDAARRTKEKISRW